MSTRRWLWSAGVPVGVGLVLIAVIPGRGERYDITVTMAVWFVILLASLVVAAAIGLVLVGRWWSARQRGQGRNEAGRAAYSDRMRLLMRLDHELKNPLTAINAGVANLRASSDDGGSSDREVLDSIESQARRLGRLVADLRKLAELETSPIEWAPVDMTELLREIEAAIGELAGHTAWT